jgi:hypothetical protein
LQHNLAGAIAFEPFIGYRWMGDIPAQAFELSALIGGTTHRNAYSTHRVGSYAPKNDVGTHRPIELA